LFICHFPFVIVKRQRKNVNVRLKFQLTNGNGIFLGVIMRSFKINQILLFLAILLPPAVVRGQSQAEHRHGDHAPTAASSATESLSIPDVTVLNEDGKEVRFYSDLVKDRIVAINFVFTTCTTVCPPLGATFARLQRSLGSEQTKNVMLISISVDPAVDTPEKLKAWAGKFGAQPGWTLVTGSKAELDKLLRALGGYTAQKEDHTPTVLIGDAKRNKWTRVYGLAKNARLMETIEQMSDVKK
jgi:cytochrome oxidase Cu insertion factor (SCO1/SenC/PrrC family)